MEKEKGLMEASWWERLTEETVIQVYALISKAEEAEVEWFYEDQQDLLN